MSNKGNELRAVCLLLLEAGDCTKEVGMNIFVMIFFVQMNVNGLLFGANIKTSAIVCIYSFSRVSRA